MANLIDEQNGPFIEEGREIRVVNKTQTIEVGLGSKVFEVLLFVLFIIPGLIFQYRKVKAKTNLRQIEQKLQHDASQVDNYLEQRVIILNNLVKLVERSTQLDKEIMTTVAAYRSGVAINDANRAEIDSKVQHAMNSINVQLENYPDLKSQSTIADAIQQNSYLQKEITAAREIYNDTINRWNSQIMIWPANMIVAMKKPLNIN